MPPLTDPGAEPERAEPAAAPPARDTRYPTHPAPEPREAAPRPADNRAFWKALLRALAAWPT